MNISETIKALPDDAKMLLCGCDFLSTAKDTYVCSTDDLKRLIDALEKCETAIDSLPHSRGLSYRDELVCDLRDELLSEIREALGK